MGLFKKIVSVVTKPADFIANEISNAGAAIDDFVREEIPGGWGTVAVIGGGAALASGAGAAASGSGAVATPVASWGGTVTPIAGGGTAGGVLGGTGLLAGSTGAGFTATGAGAPGLATMGGGTGLLANVPGGVVGATGFTAANALPVLGSPSSFINNPAVLGQPVIAPEVPSTLSVSDAFRAARLASNLMGGTQPTTPQQAQDLGQMQATGVDLLSLPQLSARTPGVASLLSPSNVNALPTFDLITGQSLLPNRSPFLLG
jgi:hypothetical protein